jgi:hypothetical protein
MFAPPQGLSVIASLATSQTSVLSSVVFVLYSCLLDAPCFSFVNISAILCACLRFRVSSTFFPSFYSFLPDALLFFSWIFAYLQI